MSISHNARVFKSPVIRCMDSEWSERLSSVSFTHVPVFFCVFLFVCSGWWAARGSGPPCCCVCSGLSPCKLPSDPRLSMRELIMADGPRCKRRKQANPRRKNGKSGLGKCLGKVVRCVNRRVTRDAERGDRTDQSPDGSTLKRAQVEIGLNRRDVNKGHVAELFLSVFSRKFGNESLCAILKRALNTFDACGFFTLAFRLLKKLLTVQRHRLDSPSALFSFILRCMN